MQKSSSVKKSPVDSILLILVLLLVFMGLLVLFSASEYNGRVRFHDSAYYFKKQLFATALGLGAMYAVSSVDYHIFFWWDRKSMEANGGCHWGLFPSSRRNLPKWLLSFFLYGR